MSENPTREKIQSDLAEVLRISYETQKKQESELKIAVNKIIEFFFKPPKKDTKIPYQYLEENQKEFYDSANTISIALSQVEPVLSDMKTRMFNLEKGNQVIDQPTSPDTPTIIAQNPPEKRPLISNPFHKTKKPAPTNPYQSTIDIQRRTINVIYDWELTIEYQAFGVDLVKELELEGIQNYLTYHRNKYCWDIAPNILRIFKQGLELQLDKEKQYALQSLTAQMKESFQVRNDFVQPPR